MRGKNIEFYFYSQNEWILTHFLQLFTFLYYFIYIKYIISKYM